MALLVQYKTLVLLMFCSTFAHFLSSDEIFTKKTGKKIFCVTLFYLTSFYLCRKVKKNVIKYFSNHFQEPLSLCSNINSCSSMTFIESDVLICQRN